MRLSGLLLVGSLCLAPLPVDAAGGVSVGPQFQVNTYTTGDQGAPHIGVDGDGSFTIVWYTPEVHARRYDASGTPLGGEFQINTYMVGSVFSPRIGMQESGAFVVAWWAGEFGTPGDDPDWSIQARRFAADGSPQDDQFQVNTYTPSLQAGPRVAGNAAGQFVVAWGNLDSGGYPGPTPQVWSVRAQSFAADGSRAGGEVLVSSDTSASHHLPAVAVAGDGSFVVVWQTEGGAGDDTSGTSIQGRRFDAAGTPLGPQFQVNSYTPYDQQRPAVAMGSGGEFVVVWESYSSAGDDTSATSIQGRRFNADGTPLGPDVQVNTYTLYIQRGASVALTSDGGFIAAWHSFASPGDLNSRSVHARYFDAAGDPQTPDFRVNTFTPGDQIWPAVAAGPGDGFVVTWQSDGSPGTDHWGDSIQGQRLLRRPHLFSDGFESGDLGAWSETVP